MNRPIDPDEERRKLFRRMEWTFVWAPPLLALFVALFGGFVLAFLIPIEGTTLLGRWALALLVILVIPVLVYVVKEALSRNNDTGATSADSGDEPPAGGVS